MDSSCCSKARHDLVFHLHERLAELAACYLARRCPATPPPCPHTTTRFVKAGTPHCPTPQHGNNHCLMPLPSVTNFYIVTGVLPYSPPPLYWSPCHSPLPHIPSQPLFTLCFTDLTVFPSSFIFLLSPFNVLHPAKFINTTDLLTRCAAVSCQPLLYTFSPFLFLSCPDIGINATPQM